MKVPDFHGTLQADGTDYVVEASLLGRDPARSELCLNLWKPNFWIRVTVPCSPK